MAVYLSKMAATMVGTSQTSKTSREKLSSDCAEFDSIIIKYGFKGYKLSEIARNIYSSRPSISQLGTIYSPIAVQ